MAKLIKVDDIKWQSTQNGGWDRPYKYVTKQDIDRMPAVDAVEVVHGRWIWKDGCFHCSKCKTSNDHTPAYCEGCGALMDLEVE